MASDMANRFASKFWETATTNQQVTVPLAALGGLWAGYQLYQLASSVHLHFLHRSSLGRYRSQSTDGKPASWALITGSSDGIGKGFAEELCSQGFNVILHGRNEQKLNGVKAELERQWPKSQIKTIVFDSAKDITNHEKLEAMVRSIADLNITVLINNVGGGPRPAFLTLAEFNNEGARTWIDTNVSFTVEITRLLIPVLVKRSPALMVNVGSYAGTEGFPYLSVYSGTKAFGESWTKAINLEMKAEGHKVEVFHLLVGAVQSGSEAHRKLTLFVPSSRRFAADSLHKVGSGRSVVTPYVGHAMQVALFNAFPQIIREKLFLNVVKDEVKAEREMFKKQ
ncbi:uncharacterized protein LTR77_000314 [Saxophila tyrrhenica]|uniref:NAD(P)-binding protein n=1 Tax=Saxophila tyrrhenica TaxID=1690608 RepID=A0AAV9PQH2_9PEZI|nr:hypothetical protein LTR77_000314 [Saxophila tyrrhenica]